MPRSRLRAYNALVHDHLERARTAASPELRLAALVDAWRATRLPELADAIDRLGDRVVARYPIVRPGERGLQLLWRRAHAGDAVAIGRVLADLAGPQDPLAPLLELPDDPRLPRRLRARDIADTCTKLVSIGDARSVAWLRGQRQQAREAADEIAAIRLPRIGRAARAAIAALAEDATERALLREVYARPRSDEPRLIYADHLLSQGDPRGELIVLQCARSLDIRGTRRLAELLDRFGPRWTGAIEPYLVSPGRAKREFRRGFLARCRINGANTNVYADRAAVAVELAKHRAWATLEIVEVPRHSVGWHAPLVAHLEKLRVEVKLVA